MIFNVRDILKLTKYKLSKVSQQEKR